MRVIIANIVNKDEIVIMQIKLIVALMINEPYVTFSSNSKCAMVEQTNTEIISTINKMEEQIALVPTSTR